MLQKLKTFLKRFFPPSANTFHACVMDWEARTCEERRKEEEEAARAEALDRRIQALEEQLRQQDAALEEQLRQRDVALAEQLQHQDAMLNEHLGRQDVAIENLVDSLVGQLGELKAAVCSLESQGADQGTLLKRMESRMDSLETRLGEMEAWLAARAQEGGDSLRAFENESLSRSQLLTDQVGSVQTETLMVKEQIHNMTLYSENRAWNEQISLMLEVWLGAERLHRVSFAGFQDKYLGKEVVLCGAGPTLNYYIPTQEDAVYMALNRAFLYQAISFDYIFSADWRGIEPIQDELAAYEGNHCVKLLARQTYCVNQTGFPDEFIARCKAVSFFGDDYRTSFTRNVMHEPLRTTFTSALSALQLLLYTNPKRIYLVGIDMSDGHFNDDQEETLWWSTEDGKLAPHVMRIWEDFKGFARAYYPNTEIISINPVRLKGLFKDEYTEPYLDALRQERT